VLTAIAAQSSDNFKSPGVKTLRRGRSSPANPNPNPNPVNAKGGAGTAANSWKASYVANLSKKVHGAAASASASASGAGTGTGTAGRGGGRIEAKAAGGVAGHISPRTGRVHVTTRGRGRGGEEEEEEEEEDDEGGGGSEEED